MDIIIYSCVILLSSLFLWSSLCLVSWCLLFGDNKVCSFLFVAIVIQMKKCQILKYFMFICQNMPLFQIQNVYNYLFLETRNFFCNIPVISRCFSNTLQNCNPLLSGYCLYTCGRKQFVYTWLFTDDLGRVIAFFECLPFCLCIHIVSISFFLLSTKLLKVYGIT